MKVKRYTDEEIRDIKKWRSEGLTWAEISDRNGRSADAMQVKFSTLKRGVPEYKKQEIPPVIIPEGVSSFNERKAATEAETVEAETDTIIPEPIHVGKEPKLAVRARIHRGYTVRFRAEVHFKTLDEVWDYFHTEPLLMAFTSECEVSEENDLVLEEKITGRNDKNENNEN